MLSKEFSFRFCKQAWPDPDTDLLIKAVMLPPEAARVCWRLWKDRQDIDECSWPQHKLLARFSGRLPDIDADCEEIPRLHGMAKSMWTTSQLRLNRSAVALDVLLEAGIECCLLKTAAMEALAPVKLTRRVTSDIDMMVKRTDLRQTLELLYSHGWAGPETQELALRRCRYHPGVNLIRGSEANNSNSDVDIHHQPVHLPFLSDSILGAMWARTQQANFRGRPVLVPSAEDMMIFTAMQGIRRFIPSHLSSGMWPLDLAEMISQLQLDWDRVVELARECQGVLAVLGCLTYLRSQLQLEVPAEVLRNLETSPISIGDAASFYAQARTYGALRFFNLPAREFMLINRHRAFCQDGYKASQVW